MHRDDVHALDLARQLMALGADPNARIAKELKDQPRQRTTGGTGATPFFLAARVGDAELMRVLAEYGADPFLPSDDNTTPLMAAAGVGVYLGAEPGTNEEALEAFTFVLDLGGNIHTVNAKGETALHGAAARGAIPIVQMLVERGACLDATNDAGHTPLAIAEGVPQLVFRQQPETAALLRRLMESRTPTSPDRPRYGLTPTFATAQSTSTAVQERLAHGPEDRTIAERCILGFNAGPPIVPLGCPAFPDSGLRGDSERDGPRRAHRPAGWASAYLRARPSSSDSRPQFAPSPSTGSILSTAPASWSVVTYNRPSGPCLTSRMRWLSSVSSGM